MVAPLYSPASRERQVMSTSKMQETVELTSLRLGGGCG